MFSNVASGNTPACGKTVSAVRNSLSLVSIFDVMCLVFLVLCVANNVPAIRFVCSLLHSFTPAGHRHGAGEYAGPNYKFEGDWVTDRRTGKGTS